MEIQLLEEVRFTVRTPDRMTVCEVGAPRMALRLGAQQRVLERPLPVYAPLQQYITGL